MKNRKIIISLALIGLLSWGQTYISYAQEAEQQEVVSEQEETQEVVAIDAEQEVAAEAPIGEVVEETPVTAQEETFGTPSLVEEEPQEPQEVNDSSMKKLKRPEKALETLDAFDYSISRLQNVSGRISNKLSELEAQGVSVGPARGQIKQANNLIRSSFGELKKIKEQTKRFIAAGAYEDGYVEATKEKLATAANDGKGAQDIMKKIISELKKEVGDSTKKVETKNAEPEVVLEPKTKADINVIGSGEGLLDSVSGLLDSKE